MANDFSGDSSVKALYRFEDAPGLLVDSSGNGNDLTDNNTVGKNTTYYKEGAQSLFLDRANQETASRADADLSAGFPLKNGDSTKQMSACCWFRCSGAGWDTYMNLVSKSSSTSAERSVTILLSSGKMSAWWATPTLTSCLTCASGLTVGRWYWLGYAMDGVRKQDRVMVWDDTNSVWITDEIFYRPFEPQAGQGPLTIGNHSGYSEWWRGYMDEVVIFNRVISREDMTAIKNGNYSGSGTTAFKALQALSQVEYIQASSTMRVQHLLAQVEYQQSNPAMRVSHLMAQVEYEPAVGGTVPGLFFANG